MELKRKTKSIPEFLCIGFFCHDLKEGDIILGGTASYASLMAAHLGKKTAVLTSVGNDFKFFDLFKKYGIEVLNKPADKTTIFENIYKNGIRTQYIHCRSKPLFINDLPQSWGNAPIVKFCLIADEVDFSLLNAFPNSLVGATIQGWLRKWDTDGKITPKIMAWEKLKSIDIIFMSDADIDGFENALPEIIKYAKMVVMTKGAEGASIFYQNKKFEFPSYPVNEVDPTGAGDIFATAFLIHFHETNDLSLSAAFAHAAASYVVEHVGVVTPPMEIVINRYADYLKRFPLL